MLSYSKQDLIFESKKEKVRPEILEKVWHLLDILREISKNETLSSQFALKGGTALNLFYLNVPRLSVDIDLNYIGSSSLQMVKQVRPGLEKILESIYTAKGMSVRNAVTAHAGGKYQLRYPSVLNEGHGTLEVDLNYMFRIPLFEPQKLTSTPIGSRSGENILVVAFEEVIAGKLCALLNRKAARDIFDTYSILFHTQYEVAKLKTAFLAYWVMESSHGAQIPFEKIGIDEIN
ncbi:MAG: nucleotidyl transferase AbiEii/AbiGii toxin family protein, partial [Ignavibacteria bacterium]|nr:nucleotidyl transferase AbiEii/AbiGii toxin family protein [Ignavibacteria bacterium]